MGKLEVVFTDLDGTLLNDHQEVSIQDFETLEKLGQDGICRVIATGRSWFSFQKVIPNDFPIDYLVFSSGAGILDYKNKKLIYSRNHGEEDTKKISSLLEKERFDFMTHFEVPENHKFVFQSTASACEDFHRRLDVYKEFAIPYDAFKEYPKKSAQVIAIVQDQVETKFEQLQKLLPEFKLIRATSPIDGLSTWLEIFPKDVSKGHTCDWLCAHLKIDKTKSIGVGNDYNDIDLLEFTKYSYVVDNAPAILKESYEPVSSNAESGFSAAISKLL